MSIEIFSLGRSHLTIVDIILFIFCIVNSGYNPIHLIVADDGHGRYEIGKHNDAFVMCLIKMDKNVRKNLYGFYHGREKLQEKYI